MSFFQVSGHRARYRLDGPRDAPLLVMSNSLGARLEMWDAQMDVLQGRFRVLRYDTRGQGDSQVTPGPYTMEQLGRDVLILVDAIGGQRFSFCGLSMGGLVGQWLALHAGARLNRLVLCNTSARVGTDDSWNTRIDTVTREGMTNTAKATIARWFTADFAEKNSDQVAPVLQQLLATDPAGYVANCAAVRDADFRNKLRAINVPLLFVAGTHDLVATVADARAVVEQVRDAELVELAAAHLSNIESQAAFNTALVSFLDR